MANRLKDFFDRRQGRQDTSESDTLNPVVSEEDIQKQQAAIANQRRKEVERQYQEQHPDQIREEKELSFENKTNKLKKRLNIAIITVFGLIIIVFLILFFV